MKKNIHNAQQGFTLIEVIMAMAILGIGILAIVALQIKNVTYNTGSKKQTDGYTWALDQIEKLYVADYTAVATGSATRGPYQVVWVVTDHPNINNAKIVNVQVDWSGQPGRPIADLVFTRTQTSF